MNEEQFEAALAGIVDEACPIFDSIISTAKVPMALSARRHQLAVLVRINEERLRFWEDHRPIVPLLGKNVAVKLKASTERYLHLFRLLDSAIPEAVCLWKRMIRESENSVD